MSSLPRRAQVLGLMLVLAGTPCLVPDARSEEQPPDPHVVRGRIEGATGRPLEDVAVELFRIGHVRLGYARPSWDLDLVLHEGIVTWTLVSATRTDGEGRFLLTGRDPWWRHLVRVRPTPPLAVQVLRVWSYGELDVRLRAGVPFEGRLVDAAGRGVRGVVTYRREPRLDRAASTRFRRAEVATDEEGRFLFAAVSPGRIELRVRVPGRALVDGILTNVPRQGVLDVPVEPAERLEVSGRVRDEAGAPVGGARVVLTASADTPRRTPRYVLAGTTDADGSYAIAGVPRGRLHGVQVVAEGYVPTGTWYRNAILGAAFIGDVVVGRGFAVTGTVRDAAGLPLKDVFVRSTLGGHAFTDARGRYRLDGLPLRPAAVLAIARDHYQADVPAHVSERYPRDVAGPLLPENPGDVLRHDLVLAPRPCVTGRVVDADLEGVAGATIVTDGLATLSDEYPMRVVRGRADRTGRFVLRGVLPRGGWHFLARAGDRIMERGPRLEVGPEGLTDLELVVRPGGRVRGRVVDENGSGLKGVRVRLVGPSGGGRGLVESVAGGRFAFERVLEGSYPVVVGGGPKNLDRPVAVDVDVDWGETVEDVELVHRPWGEIRGHVERPDGTPVEGVTVSLESQIPTSFKDRWVLRGGHDFWEPRALSDAQGRFRCAKVRTGTWWIRPARKGSEKSEATVGEEDVVLVYHEPTPPRYVEVSVAGPAGRAVGALQLAVEDASSAGWAGPATSIHTAMHAGSRARLLPHGEAETVGIAVTRVWDVHGRPLNVLPVERREVARGGSVSVRLEEALSIAGHVLDEAGDPVPDLVVGFREEARSEGKGMRPGQRARRTDPHGRFCFLGWAPGTRAHLWLEAQVPWLAAAEVEAEAGDQDVVLRVRRGKRLHGRVTDSAGRALVGVRVVATLPGAGWRGAKTGVAGRFAFDGLPEEPLKLEVNDASQSFDAQAPPHEYLPYAGEARPGPEEVVIVLDEGAWITGEVVWPANPQCRYIDVESIPLAKGAAARRERARERLGRGEREFCLGPLRPGPYRVRATVAQAGNISAVQDVTAPARDLRLVLAPPLRLRGRLVGEERGGFTVRALYGTADGVLEQVLPLEEDGTFSARPWRAGAVLLHASRPGDDRYALLLTRASRGDDVQVKLVSGGAIRGTLGGVLASIGRRHVHVMARREDGVFAHGVLGEEGRFAILGLPPGRYEVEAFAYRDGRRWTSRAHAVPVGTKELTLRSIAPGPPDGRHVDR